MNKISILKNTVQEYAWGSRTFIPELTGKSSPADKPLAELWMGDHPKGPSKVYSDGRWISLGELIRKDPSDILGKSVAEKFSKRLPFLFKVLAAARPLSIQAHPDADQARQGFAREEGGKIPLDALDRNYKDQNHKPELICALSPFLALKGFRKIEEIILLMEKVIISELKKELAVLQREPDSKGLYKFFKALLMMDHKRQDNAVSEMVAGIKKSPDIIPEFEWVIRLNKEYPGDIGALFPIILNMVQLMPGEAMFIPAGELHSYLKGMGIELMANSDNVLRGGLTPKHVDISELLKILNFTCGRADILRPKKKNNNESIYAPAAEEFQLSVISVQDGSSFDSPLKRSVEIMLCIKGDANITGDGNVLPLRKGTSFIIPSSINHYRIEGEAIFFKATVPV